MCSLSAVYNVPNALKILKGTMSSGINRGDESAGMGIKCDKISKNRGLCISKRMHDDRFIKGAYEDASRLSENDEIYVATGQTRYSTKGTSDIAHAQPFLIKEKNELIINHNGTIANSDALRKKFPELKCLSQSDTEIAGRIIASEYDLIDGVEKLVEEAVGAYELHILDKDGRLAIFRDPHGFHPLWYWYDKQTHSLLSASEDFPLYAVRPLLPEELSKNFEPVEVRPGELILIDKKSVEKHYFDWACNGTAYCSFETFYFQKPFSTTKGKPNYLYRKEVGKILGEIARDKGLTKNIDIVVPVRDSGTFFAEGFAEATGIELVEGLAKNRFERVYMDPEERRTGNSYDLTRLEKAKLKHVATPIVKGKRVAVIDDSNVRGNTSVAIDHNLSVFGALEKHWFLGYPPCCWGCIYGLDHNIRKKLVAAPFFGNSDLEKEVARKIAADSVTYIPLEDEMKILGGEDEFCWATVTGNYPTEVPKECASAIEL